MSIGKPSLSCWVSADNWAMLWHYGVLGKTGEGRGLPELNHDLLPAPEYASKIEITRTMSMVLSYREYGDTGTPVVLLHGLFGSAQNWDAIARRLAANHPVYALDLRNHGNSPWSPSMTYSDLVDDTRGFIEQHDLKETVVLGHSMGGKAAMLLALEHPDLVERLIVVDIAPVAYLDIENFLAYTKTAPDIGRFSDAGAQLFLPQNLAFRNEHFDWRVNLSALIANIDQLVDFPAAAFERVYTGRTLFLYGSQSDHVHPEHHSAIYRLFPNAEIVVIPNAGHWVHADQPDLLVEKVLAFLAD